MWDILGAGRRKLLKFVQGLWNVGWHVDITGVDSARPGKGKSAEEVGGPID